MSTPDTAEPAGDPQPCPPCRGTGIVISNLGGTPSELPCPWCDGTGVLNPGADAQAHWRADGPPSPAGHTS